MKYKYTENEVVANQRGAVHFVALILFATLIFAVFSLIDLWHESNQLALKVKELDRQIEMLDSRVKSAELKVSNVELKVGL